MKSHSCSRLLARATILTAASLLVSACAFTSTEATSSQGPAADEKYPEHTTGSRLPTRR